MSKLKQLANQTLIYGISTILVRSLNWLISPFHSYVFDNSPAGVGIITEIYAYVAFFNVLLMYGMETAFFRFASHKKDANKVFSTAFISLLGTTFIFALGIFLSADKIAALLSYPNYGFIIKLVALILAFDTLSNIPFARLRLESKPLKYVSIKLLNVIITVVLNIIFLYPMYKNAQNGGAFDEKQALFYVFFANMIASLATFLVFIPQIIKTKLQFDKQTWQQMLKYGLPLVIVGLAGIVNETIDRILLKYLLPGTLEERNVQVGIYGMAYKLSIFMSLVVQAYRMGAEPFFFKQAKDEDALPILAKAMDFFVIAGVAVFLAVSLNLDWIIMAIGPSFRAGKDLVPILLMAYLFLGIFYNLSVWYKVGDKTHYATIISITGAVVTILINVLLIPKYGYWASAWATFFSYFVMTIFSWLWGKKYYPVPYNISKNLAYISIGIGIYLIFYFVPINNMFIKLILANAILVLFIVVAFGRDIKKLLSKK